MRCRTLVPAAIVIVTGCGGSSPSGAVDPPGTFMSIVSLPGTFQSTPTYDGSGQATEPDVIFVPQGWNGYRYWMTAAPYTGGKAENENASVWATNDPSGPGQKWLVPPGAKNPETGQPPFGYYYSDQSLFLDSDGTMYLYFSMTNRARKMIYAISSKDGWKTVSPRRLILSALVAASNPLVSTILRVPDSNSYYLWYTDQATLPPRLVRYEGTSPVGPFKNPIVCQVNGVPPFRVLWEQNIIQAPGSTSKLFGLITLAEQASAGSITALVFMISDDEGRTWTLDRQSLLHAGSPGTWDDFEIYRASLEPSAATLSGASDTYDIWYSGSNVSHVWHVAYAQGQLN